MADSATTTAAALSVVAATPAARLAPKIVSETASAGVLRRPESMREGLISVLSWV